MRVNVPSEGITPSGVKTITSNGTHDVTEFAQAKVEVPVGVNPSGTKTIDIVENGSVTENIREFENVTVNVNVPTGGGGNEARVQSLVMEKLGMKHLCRCMELLRLIRFKIESISCCNEHTL